MSEPITNLEDAVRVMGALPMPMGPERLTPQERDMVLGLIADAKPATSSLLLSFAESVRNRREHDHPQWEDFYCLNLSSYMGERSGPVLRRLVDVEAENEQLRARVAELEAASQVDNEALDDAAKALRGRALLDELTVQRAESAHNRRLGVEGEHYAAVHHDYRLGHDLPETGGAR